jgi:hypothetical protein
MWRTIWMSLSTPFIAIWTGKYLGYSVTRNPLSWLGLFVWGLLLIPFTIIIYPIYILLTLLGFRHINNHGKTATIKDDIIEISTKKEGVIDKLPVREIKKVVNKFTPPIMYPVLILRNGERIELKATEAHLLYDECRALGIEVDETPDRDG